MHSRKAFLALAGAGAAAAVTGCGGDDDDEEREARTAADLEIVRYVLGLERVEVAFWEQAAQRGNLDQVGAADLANTIARNERQHVESLERWARRLEGDGGEARSTNFAAVFAAGPQEVLRTGATLENLSAAAYLGQLNRIQDQNLLAAMLGIHSVEGRQAAAVNRLAGRGFSLGTGQLEGALPDGAFAQPLSMADVRRELRRVPDVMRITRASFLALVASGITAPRVFGDVRDDLAVLNFALTIEYVESGLYRMALKEVPGLSADTKRLVEHLRDQEIEHVDALRGTITMRGGKPNDRPRLDFGGALSSEAQFLKLANTLEDTGVSAYNGAAPQFESEDFVAAFASLAQIEGRHAALIRMERDKPPAPLPIDKASIQQAVRSAFGPYTVE